MTKGFPKNDIMNTREAKDPMTINETLRFARSICVTFVQIF